VINEKKHKRKPENQALDAKKNSDRRKVVALPQKSRVTPARGKREDHTKRQGGTLIARRSYCAKKEGLNEVGIKNNNGGGGKKKICGKKVAER